MSVTPITQVITTLPDAPDPATDTPPVFSTKAAASVLAQKAMVPQINTLSGQMNVLAGEVDDLAVEAAASAAAALVSEGNASDSEDAAAASAAAALNAPGTSATSTTELTIGTGETILTIQADKAFSGGQSVVIADAAAPADNWMWGHIASYSGTTLTVQVASYHGGGTKESWIISLSPNPAGVYVVTGETSLETTTLTLDYATGNVFSHTAEGNLTITPDNFPAAPGGVALLKLTDGGAYTVEFAGTPIFPLGEAPTLTAAGVDYIWLFGTDSSYLVSVDFDVKEAE